MLKPDWWWEKYLSKRRLIKHTCSWRVNLLYYRLRNNSKDYINPLWSCTLEVENTLHFFLHCQDYSTFRMGFMIKINQIDENFHTHLLILNKVSLLLYGDTRFDDNKNYFVLSASITHILETERFSTSLFQSGVWIFILA